MNPVKFAFKALRAIFSPRRRFIALAVRGFYDAMPDEEYLKRMYKAHFGRELNLQHPKTFTEKIQWLKLYDRRPEYTAFVDKYEAKRVITGIIGGRYVPQVLGVYSSFDEIDFDALPGKFVLKCTHDSGSVVTVPAKSTFNKAAARKLLERGLKRNFSRLFREYAYRDIKPRIIAESFIDGISAEYKIFCFDGKPGLILVCKGTAHAEGRTNDYYDMYFRHIPVSVDYPNSPEPEERPAQLDEMLEIAGRLSQGIPQVRVDFFLAEGKVYVGEMTFYHEAGYTHFTPESFDEEFGRLITLPEKRC